MSSKLYMLGSWNVSADITTAGAKIATGTSQKVLLQIAPTMGIEIVEWGISFDGSAAATPGQCELVEVDVAASSGTASQIPVTYLATALASSTTSTISIGAALQATAGQQYEIGTVTFGQTSANNEQMLVTGGGAGTTLTVTRGVNGTTPLAAITTSAVVYGLPGTGILSDIQPYSGQPSADPTHALVATPGTALTGFNFTTQNSPTRVRNGDYQLLPPTAPYVKQFPLERGFEIHPGRFGQIRVTFGTTVNASCYMIFQA